MQVNWWAGVIAFLTRGENIKTQALVAWELWKKIHSLPNDDDEDEDENEPHFDAWDIKYGRQTEDVVARTWKLPDFEILDTDEVSVSPFLAVEVDQEWQRINHLQA